ncbi:hypothetical protein [Prosthecobacter sp.]|uniref:hypothetical protein n=1 Tax=Prosthecobacter sp. TaxID=1965333 RepID=UPI0037843309
MKNWRTTIFGALLAGATFLGQFQSNGGNLSDWKLWVIPLLMAVLGYLAKDAGVTGSLKALGLLLCCLLVVSCGTTAEQRKSIAVRVGGDVLADVANGATVWLTTGSGAAAGASMIALELKQLPGQAADAAKVLQAVPVTSAKQPVVVTP